MHIEKISKYYHTLKYLRARQVFYRIYYRLKRIRISLDVPSDLEKRNWSWSVTPIQQVCLLAPSRFRFLSLEGDIKTAEDWNDPSREKLWLYNLHYFDDLNAVNNDERYAWHIELINRWIAENPPCSGNGWEPYPMSLRIVNWIKWLSRQESQNVGWNRSLFLQTKALSQQLEFHILGNHLLANAKAMIFSGLYFKGKEAERFLRTGLKTLDKELKEQFLEDGAHFELSPMYHKILLWDLLELIKLCYISRHPLLEERLSLWKAISLKALFWLKTIIHPDGEISFFNDAAFGIGPKAEEVFSFATELGLEVKNTEEKTILLVSSGYSRISLYDHTLIIDHGDVGPDYLPGHAHADTLSFEWSLGQQRLLVNSGTSVYGTSKERLRQRQTKAHNTVEVDGEDSSEVWGGFRVARRAHGNLLSIEDKGDSIFLLAEQDGYMRLKGKVLHRRTFHCTKQSLRIDDTLFGKYSRAFGYFHLHPDVKVESDRLFLPDGRSILIESTSPVTFIDSTWHPGFGVSVKNKLIRSEFRKSQESITFRIDRR